MSERVDGGDGGVGRPVRVLFVCTGNSARSVMAEALLRRTAGDAVDVYSAGTDPRGGVHPLTVRVLDEIGIDVSAKRPTAAASLVGMPFDYVITVCDQARQVCPVFPGDGERLHWSLPDPSIVAGSDEAQMQAFEQVARQLTVRIRGLLNRIAQERGGPGR